MKVTSKKISTDGFVPFELTIKVESENVASDLYGIFNHSAILEAVDPETAHIGRLIREELKKNHSRCSDNFTRFATKLADWFQ